ncbi:ribonuclease H1 [Novymonas esmeraldas]|uniref:Ribonuclease H n=1 Tax=Novymonas esmeraldas TaxID=1808958 RepID=A0AAW0EWA6_9TRYP
MRRLRRAPLFCSPPPHRSSLLVSLGVPTPSSTSLLTLARCRVAAPTPSLCASLRVLPPSCALVSAVSTPVLLFGHRRVKYHHLGVARRHCSSLLASTPPLHAAAAAVGRHRRRRRVSARGVRASAPARGPSASPPAPTEVAVAASASVPRTRGRRRMPPPSYYAVAVGRARGIVSTWAQCTQQVTGYPGSVYKGFNTLAEARAFLASHPAAGVAASGGGDGSGGSATAVTAPSRAKRPRTRASSAEVTDSEAEARQACRRRVDVSAAASVSSSTSPTAGPVVVVVYVDGACSHNGTPRARAGYGGYYGSLADPRNFSLAVPLSESQTNNRGELRAVIHALVQSFVDAGAPAGALEATHLVDPSPWRLGDLDSPLPHLVICTDSRYVIDGLTRYAKTWVENGFVLSTKAPVQNQDLWRQLIRLRDRYNTLYAAQQQEQPPPTQQPREPRPDDTEAVQHTCHNTRNDPSEGVELLHVRGHSKIHGNEMADSLAVSGSRQHPT